MQSDQIIQLKKLKGKLENQNMSVLVGAGFSKNISSIFPSWWELLYDLTSYLFGDEIRESIFYRENKSNKEKKDYFNEKITYYLQKVGYLELVSEYIQRKGYREAITTYIEERTPKKIIEADKIFIQNKLNGKENREEVTEDMMRQHRLLLHLPWNNIYTTNYDEMLEFANDSSSAEDIRTEIKSLNDEIENLQTQENDITHKLSKATDETEKRNLSFDLEFTKEKIKQKEKDSVKFNKALSECISIVTDSSQLSVKRNKNIIKIHGTLRKSNSSFGFDGDVRRQYIIAKEDYESYPEKHEAFTQLMRISLLQESYCLIGFSGVDPNFIEWIKWVRDILERNNSVGSKQEIKIFFIDAGNESVSEDKRLFFENYRVYRLSIMDEKVIQFLESHSERKIKDRTDKKEVFEHFFYYLSNGMNISFPKATLERINKSKYEKCWESLKLYEPQKIKIDELTKNTSELIFLKSYNRIPKVTFGYTHNKKSLIYYGISLIEKVKDYQDKKLELLKLILLAIKDLFLTLNFTWNKDEILSISNYTIGNLEIQNELNLLKIRQSVLQLDKKTFDVLFKLVDSKKDNAIYESILFATFNFDFKSLQEKLQKWKPNSYWVLKKSALLALLDLNKAEAYLQNCTFSLENEKVQDQLYFFQLLRFLKQGLNFSIDKDLNDKISSLEKLGFKGVYENLEIILNDLQERSDNIAPYGASRFSISNAFSISNELSNNQKGLQFIQVLIEVGFPLELRNVYLLKSDKWYRIFKSIFEFFPYPCIFYSLQYSDKEFLRRIAQDFVYSDTLKDAINDILPRLMNAYLAKETPNSYRKNILFFCSELFIGVDLKLWEHLFYKIWRSENFKRFAFDERHSEKSTFVKAGLIYIKSKSILRNIVAVSLKHSDSNIGIEYLYQLNKNKHAFSINNLQNKSISKITGQIIFLLPTNEFAWFAIGNIYNILSAKQKQIIIDNLRLVDFDSINNERIWKIFLFFAARNPSLISKMKKGIISNKNLWDAGFTKSNTLSSSNNYIRLKELSKNRNRKSGIKWTKNECKIIFQKMVVELEKIENFRTKRDERSFLFILEEMGSFLISEKEKLKSNLNYEEIYKRVNTLYIKDRGYNTILDGILSDEKSQVVWALSELSLLIDAKVNTVEVGKCITVLLNKILLQSQPSLEESMNYLSTWIGDDRNKKLFNSYETFILSILEQYYKKDLPSCDKPFVLEQLITIADILKKWGLRHDYIDKWIERKRNYRYLNIKHQ